MLTLFVLIPVVLGVNPYWKLEKDAVSSVELNIAGDVTRGVMKVLSIQNSVFTNTVCPNGMTQCLDNATCCPAEGQDTYGCCPGTNAVCCSETYCCPEGYTCNVAKGTCVKNGLEIASYLIQEMKVEHFVCPDKSSQCPDKNTCCKLVDGNYACCPLVNAVCCSDHSHCCPQGYTCDVVKGTCTPPSSHEVVTNTIGNVKDSVCSCPSRYQTCCLYDDGSSHYCCAEGDANCCTEDLTCCPYGSICSGGGLCTNITVEESTDLTENEKYVKDNVNDVMKDSVCSCPSPYQTCCLYDDGSSHYCCAEGFATCCTKDLTCCPYGSICSGGGLCTNITVEESTDFTENEKHVKDNVNDVMCPGDQYTCPNGDTCCSNGSGGYECCPLPDAVCCSDHLHCCPGGYTCQVSTGFCLKSSDVLDRIPFLVKSPANRRL